MYSLNVPSLAAAAGGPAVPIEATVAPVRGAAQPPSQGCYLLSKCVVLQRVREEMEELLSPLCFV